MGGMNVSEVRHAFLIVASRTRHYGPDDPRTIEAIRALAEAKAEAAEAKAARLRALADAMAVAS